MSDVQYPLLNNFSKGELSTRMSGRTDLQGYYYGCRSMKNCIMVSQGGAERRPGTIYAGEALDPTGLSSTARLIPFEVADDETYILEIGHMYIRIWDAQTRSVISDLGDGTSYFETSYLASAGEDEVSEIQYAMTEGLLFLAHYNHEFVFVERIIDRTVEPPTKTFKIEKHHTTVFNWDNTRIYKYGEYVSYSGLVWTVIMQNTEEGVAPAEGSWTKSVESLSPIPTGDIPAYTPISFSAGIFVCHSGYVYQSLRAFTVSGEFPECKPGVELSIGAYVIGNPTYVHEDNLNTSGTTIEAALTAKFGGVGKRVTYLYETKYFDGVQIFWWQIGSTYSHYIYRVDTWNVTYSKDGDDPYWKKICSIPGGQTVKTIKKWVTSGPAQAGEVHFVSASGILYTCEQDGTTINPTDTLDWERVDGNPFFSKKGDYPAAVSFMGQRLYLGGTKSRPQTIFASKVGQYGNFNIGTDDSDPFSFEIAADRSSRIKWMMAKDNLMIGTTSSEWLITGGGISNITATNVQVLRQSAYGSAYNQAVFVADSLLFFQKGGRKLREYMYSNDNRAYLANDLTFYADHITFSGVAETAYQQNPDSIYWCIRNDGILVGLTYDRLNGIAGWHRHVTDGAFESTCCVDGAGEEEDIWLVVKRSINGVPKRFLEIMASRDQGSGADLVYQDCAKISVAGAVLGVTLITNTGSSITVEYRGESGIEDGMTVIMSGTASPLFDQQNFQVSDTVQEAESGTFTLIKNGEPFTAESFEDIESGLVSVAETVITGLDHLEGQTVSILGDLAVFSPQIVGTVSGGIGVVLPTPCNTVVCGLGYEMELEPQSIELGPSSLSSKKRISSVLLKLYRSMGGEVFSPSSGETVKLKYRNTETPFGTPAPEFTGMVEVPVDSTTEYEARISIRNSQPVPMTILAIISATTFRRS